MPDSSDHRKAQAKSSHWGCQRPSWLAGSLKATEPTLSKLWQKFNRWLTTLMKKYLSLSICHIRKQSLHINLTPSNKQRVCCCADWDLGYSDLILSRCLLVGNCIPPTCRIASGCSFLDTRKRQGHLPLFFGGWTMWTFHAEAPARHYDLKMQGWQCDVFLNKTRDSERTTRQLGRHCDTVLSSQMLRLRHVHVDHIVFWGFRRCFQERTAWFVIYGKPFSTNWSSFWTRAHTRLVWVKYDKELADRK